MTVSVHCGKVNTDIMRLIVKSHIDSFLTRSCKTGRANFKADVGETLISASRKRFIQTSSYVESNIIN